MHGFASQFQNEASFLILRFSAKNCILNASLLLSHCIPKASQMDSEYIQNAFLMHSQCFLSASSMHPYCILSASSVHPQCILSACCILGASLLHDGAGKSIFKEHPSSRAPFNRKSCKLDSQEHNDEQSLRSGHTGAAKALLLLKGPS